MMMGIKFLYQKWAMSSKPMNTKNDICTSESFYVLLSKIGFTIPGLRLHFRG